MATDSERNIKILIQTETNKAVSEVKRLNTEINRLQKQQDKFKKTTASVNQMSRSFASLATHVGKLAVIYGGFQGLQTTVRTFAEFEQSIKRLGVISGATEVELGLLEAKALSLGESTIYSASQVAEGMNAMAMAGLDTQEQLDGISSVLNLATIGMIGLEEASLITVRTMNAFGLEARDMANITDVMATGATDSAQTISELGNAYEKVGSVATAFGHSLQETTASLEIMADAGRVGSEAGTQLKIVMSRLAGNKEALKYITSLGISMYDANGRLLPFKDQLVLLRGELGKLDEQSRNIKLGEIFGEEGKASAIVLLNNLDKYDEKLKKLNVSFGTARKNAQEMQDTLIGSYKELSSALEGLAIKIGSELTPVLRSLIDDATHFIQTLDPQEVKNFASSISDLLSFLGDLAKFLVSVGSALSEVGGAFKSVTNISSGWLVVVGVLVYKMRNMLPVLRTLAVGFTALNPILLALTATLGLVSVATGVLRKEINEINKDTNIFNTIMSSLGTTFEDLANVSSSFSLQDINEVLNSLAKDTKLAEREILRLKKALADEQDDFFVDADKVRTYQNNIAILEQTLKNVAVATEDLTQKGNELNQQRTDELDAINKTRSAVNQLSADFKRVEGEVQKELDKTIEKLQKHSATLETTLGTMATKERKYVEAVSKAENDLAKLRLTHSNDRALLELNYEAKVAQIRNKGLSDLQVYNNNQKRSDEVLAKSKRAFAEGNFELAKKYLDEYDALVVKSAGEEISHTIQVREKKKENGEYELEDKKIIDKSIAQTRQEALKDIKVGHDLRKQYNDATNAIEIKAQQDVLAGEKLKLETLRVQMDLQRQMLTLIGQLVSQAKGVVFEADLTNFEKSMQDIDAKIDAITKKQREVKIEGNTDPVKDDYQNLENELSNDPIQADLSLDTTGGFTEFKKFKDGVEQPLNSQLDLVTTEADGKLSIHRSKAEQPTIATHNANTNPANSAINAFQSKAKQSTYSTHYVTVVTRQARKLGGMILPESIPKFNTGGHLQDGVGHSVKSGKLSGYGGGDKIKALLEAGEFIVRKEAVKSLGLARLHQINQGQIPKFNTGGEVGGLTKLSSNTSQSKNTTKSRSTVNLNLNLGGKTFSTIADQDVADGLARYLDQSEL